MGIRIFEAVRPKLDKSQIVGVALIMVLLVLFLILNRLPKLDVVQQDLAAVRDPAARCFQGFCVEDDPTTGFFSRWWNFSLTYLRLVAVGMGFAVLVAGLTEVFLFPAPSGRYFSSGGIKGALKGLIVGTPLTLCSACIVPISSAFRNRGAGIEVTIGIAQGSSTLNLPAVVMAFTVFTPLLAGSRIALAVIGGLLIGPLAALAAGGSGPRLESGASELRLSELDTSSWFKVLSDGLVDWAMASARYLLRLGPLMIVAGFVSGFVVQWIHPETIATYLGNNIAGIAIAATLGILINVPLLFEIPLVAALLLAGMGTAPAATLLFTAAAGGPFTFWGLAKVMPKRSIATFGTVTWMLGALGGIAVLGMSSAITGPPLAAMQVQTSDRYALERSDREAVAAAASVPAGHVFFTDVTEAAGLMYRQSTLRPNRSCLIRNFCHPERQSGGAAAADYDRDGYVDIYVSRLDGPDILFRNLGNGRFEDRTAAAGLDRFNLQSNGAVWFDAENDGDLDLYVTTIGDTRFYMFINDGDGHFTEEAIKRGAAIETEYQHTGYSIAVGDYDRDGWLDLHINEWGSSELIPKGAFSHARLLRNRGLAAPGHFEDATVQAGVVLDNVQAQTEIDLVVPTLSSPRGPFAFASAFVDLDSDGWPDLAVVSDNGHSRLFWNNGDGTFTDGTLNARVGTDKSGMGLTFGDFDGDGDLDWFVTAIYAETDECTGSDCDGRKTSGNRLYRNEGGRSFADATSFADVRNGGWGWGAVFLDYDNDGDLDLAMVGGMHHSDDPEQSELEYPRLWENDGNGRMTEVAGRVGLVHPSAAKGLLTFDYDRDGDLDLFVVNNAGTPRLYRNDGGNANRWLRIRLDGGQTNRTPIGAILEVTPLIGEPSQMRELGVGSHFLGQSELTAHFGVGPLVSSIDRVTVRWPATGEVTVLHDVPTNVTIEVREGQDGFQIVVPRS